MKLENIEYLQSKRNLYDMVVTAESAMIDAGTRERFRQIMSDEFQPGYNTDLWCPPCLFDMVKLLYRRFDDYLAAQVPATEELLFDQTINKINKKHQRR
jgi:hypothetical protein